MCTTKKLYQLKDPITVDFLESTYKDHQESVEELALSEIHSIQLAMPKFNTVAALSKMEFTKLMGKIKYRFKDTQTFMVLVAAISDTFTCMIQNNKFYDNFNGNNKVALEMMIDLLENVNILLVTYRKAVETKQLETLIDILEKSAKRIQNDEQYYKLMQRIISSLKTCIQNRLDKENNIEIQKSTTKVGNKVEPIIVKESGVKSPLVTSNNKNKPNNKLTPKNNHKKIEDKKTLVKSFQEQSLLAAALKSNKKQNAFELMMLSSKNLSKKRKLTM